MLASYNLQSTFSSYNFYNETSSPWIIGLITAAVVCYCLIGGGSRIIKTTSFLVPFMGVAYILIALLIIVMNITSLPAVFAEIFSGAFDFEAIFGGFSGSCVMYGIKRGLFSNEAGVGSAPNALPLRRFHILRNRDLYRYFQYLLILCWCAVLQRFCVCVLELNHRKKFQVRHMYSFPSVKLLEHLALYL